MTNTVVIEIDRTAQAAYVRFGRSRKVAKTVELSHGPGPFVAVDLDEAENVLGVELVGVREVTIGKVLIPERRGVRKGTVLFWEE